MAGAGVPGVRCWCRAVPGGGAVVDPNAPGVGLETGDGEEYEEATRGQRGKERWKEEGTRKSEEEGQRGQTNQQAHTC